MVSHPFVGLVSCSLNSLYCGLFASICKTYWFVNIWHFFFSYKEEEVEIKSKKALFISL